MAAGMAEPKVQEFRLTEDEELRFEVPSTDVVVELCEGQAEIFGTELVLHRRYTFSTGARVAVFTWHGCVIELVGETEGAYVAKHTPMVIYVNTHAALEQRRQEVDGRKITRGPCVMVVGPTDVGKTTLCRFLCNYAARLGRSPIFVDLDVGQGSVSIPGTMGALLIERPADPVEGFDKKSPLVFQYGHLSPSENPSLYDRLANRLAELVHAKCKASPSVNSSGLVINTCGWVKGAGYTCLLNIAKGFLVDVVVVLDQERLFIDLKRDLPEYVRIVHEPKSGGVEDRTREQRVAARRGKIKQYFYGTPRAKLFPRVFQLKFTEVQIFRVGAQALPESLMPAGMKQTEDPTTKLVPVQPGRDMVHHLLAMSLCESTTENVLMTNIAGFLCVKEIHAERGTMTVLSPQPYPLPRSIFLLSDITFVDDD